LLGHCRVRLFRSLPYAASRLIGTTASVDGKGTSTPSLRISSI
jgi:hypothetical protein